MDVVSTYLLNYALTHKMGFTLLNDYDESWVPVAIPENNMMIINMKWQKKEEVSFQIAHEIGHMIDGESCFMYDKSNIAKMKSESRADKLAIDLLLQYCIANDIRFTSCIMFLQQFCIPLKYETVAKNKMLALHYFNHPF